MLVTSLAALTAGAVGCQRVLAPSEFDVTGLPKGSLTFVSCDDNEAWISIDAPLERALATRAGLETAQAGQRGSLIRVKKTGVVLRLEMDSGLIMAAAIPADRSLWIATGIPDGLRVRSTGLRHSVDGGATWRDAGLPMSVGATAFTSETSGYAWDDATLFRTDDGGASWRRREVAGYTLATGRGPRRGVVGTSGELWVPAKRTGEPEWTSIAIVQPDLSFRIITAWENSTVEVVVPLPGAEALVLLSDGAKTSARGVRVASQGIERREEIWSPLQSSVKESSVHGDNIAILTIEGPMPTNYFARYQNTLWLSTDKGSTWAHRDVTSLAPGSICISKSGIWAASKEARTVEFRRLAR
jgi:hypothetical protein